jgi:hypothetical protein
MVRTGGNARAYSCSRSKCLTFRLRSEELPSALNSVCGHYFDRARSLPADRVQLGEMVEHESNALSIPVWKTGVYLSTPMLEINWSPVRELHLPERFCRPLPWLLGQPDKRRGTRHVVSARDYEGGDIRLRPHCLAILLRS